MQEVPPLQTSVESMDFTKPFKQQPTVIPDSSPDKSHQSQTIPETKPTEVEIQEENSEEENKSMALDFVASLELKMASQSQNKSR